MSHAAYKPRKRFPKGEGQIYAILADCDPPAVKIGFSTAPKNRVMDLQVGSPVLLDLLGSVLGDERDERKLHRLLSYEKRHGEWFECQGTVLSVIEAIREGDQDRFNKILSDDQSDKDSLDDPLYKHLTAV